MYSRVSVHVVAWNSMDFLPELLASLAAQTYRDFNVIIIDNASTDGMEAYVREHFPQVTILRNPRNIGFSPAHNQAIRYALDHWGTEELEDRFVLVTNPDTILSPTYIEALMKDAKTYPGVGSFGGKLLRAFRENQHEDEAMKETIKSERIDSTGLIARRNRMFHERGAGELDQGQYDEVRDVFGLSGALALYRASAIKDTRYNDEAFDADFFAYKEDVDLAWRLQLGGWSARYVPEAIAYHHRNMSGEEKMGVWKTMMNRRGKSRQRSFYSTRNHWNMLVKNEIAINALMAAPWIFAMEAARFFYVAIFETANLRAFAQAIARTPRMWAKRRAIMAARKVTAAEMRRWFV